MADDSRSEYQLVRRTGGSEFLGLRVPQVLLLAAALGSFALVASATGSAFGIAAGAVVAACLTICALGRINGEPLYSWAPVVTRFVLQRLRGTSRWMAPLPLLAGTPEAPMRRPTQRPGRRGPALPRCLAGLELQAVPRPGWAGSQRTLAPIGVVRDRRHGAVTILINARGSGFSLLDRPDQHALLGAWGHVLAQFGREVSPVIRIGWTLWSTPRSAAEADGHLDWVASQSGPSTPNQVFSEYRSLLADTVVHHHELRIWITVASTSRDPRARHNSDEADPAGTAVDAARALKDRCTVAGLVVSDPLSPAEIAEAVRVQADPTPTTRTRSLGLAERAGVTSVDGLADAAPLAVETHWDAVHVDGTWHRAFWISQWPQLVRNPRWLEQLLMSPPSIRTLAVSYEPIAPRVSRRTIMSEAVAIDSKLQLRERHDLRVPVALKHAHQEIDQREAELGAGHVEVGMLALLVVSESSRDRLELACQATLDLAAQCGITDLRPLHARHDAAWACSLPLGRVPDRELLRGLAG